MKSQQDRRRKAIEMYGTAGISRAERQWFWRGALAGALLMGFMCMLLATVVPVYGAEHHGETIDTRQKEWVHTLKVPGPEPRVSSCCGFGDMYEADIYQRLPNGDYIAEITEGSEKVFPDGSVRVRVPNGTRIHVPASRVNPPHDGNPMGHGIIFLSVYETDPPGVYCFVPLPMGS